MKDNEVKFTEDQLKSIETVDSSVTILAGAGSGKTAVLIERIKRIVLEKKADFSSIAAITFTEKAAGELIYRLTSEMPVTERHKVDQATITTIDGFCTKILREDAATVGLTPDFKILEEHASRMLKHRIISNTLRERLKEGDEDAERLVDEMDFRYAVACLEEMTEKRWHLKEFTSPVKLKDEREELLQKAISSFFGKILGAIDDEKKRLGAIDFVDLEIRTLELLNNHSDIKNKYQKRFKHILVDEYQDTSELQTEIIRHIYKPKTNVLCIVGDPGQSIYRFRGAYPEGIFEAKDKISKDGGKVIELKDNFRSAAPIIEFINKLFTPPHPDPLPKGERETATPLPNGKRETAAPLPFGERPGEGELASPLTPALSPEGRGRVNSNYFMPLTPRAKEIPDSEAGIISLDSTELNAEEIREDEAKKIASYIKDLINNGSYSYGDMAILMRSFTNVSIYEKALDKLKIPYCRSGGRTFLKQPEVADLILCLKALTEPSNDTLAYGLARSSIIGLSDDNCYKLAYPKDRPLLEKLTNDPKYPFLKELMETMDYLSVPELLRQIVSKSSLYNVFDPISESGQSAANIEKFISLSEEICRQHNLGVVEFLDYMDDLNTRGIGIAEPPVYGGHDDAVKIFTVHAAKGLEFGVVILADLIRGDKKYTLPYIIDNNLGLGLKLRNSPNPLASKEKTETFDKIVSHESEKSSLEEERLLYVAMTRAKEKLILPIPTASKRPSLWLKILSPAVKELRHIDVTDQIQPVNLSTPPAILSTPSVILSTPPVILSDSEGSPAITRNKTNLPTFTVSQLESYYRCPQEYLLKYKIGMPAGTISPKTAEMSANDIGNIVHKVIYLTSSSGLTGGSLVDHFKRGIPDQTGNDNEFGNSSFRGDDRASNNNQIIEAVCSDYGYVNPQEKDLKKIKRLIDTYLKSDFSDTKLKSPNHEIPFIFRSNGAVIKGTIDCIFKNNNAYSLVDFKTDTIGGKDDIENKTKEYMLQILTYAIAAKEGLKTAIEEMILLFLDRQHSEIIPLKESNYIEGSILIDNIVESIGSDNFTIKDDARPCLTCPFHHNRTCWLDKTLKQ